VLTKFTSTLSYFATPPIKLETWTPNRWGRGTTNSKPLGPISTVWWANQKHWAVVRSYLLHSFQQVHAVAMSLTLSSSQVLFITLFSAGARCCYVSTSHSKVCNYMVWWHKTNFLNQTGIFWLFSSNFTVHIIIYWALLLL
jgi:hypothetical protein